MTNESAARFPLFDISFSPMTTRSLVVRRDAGNPLFTTPGSEWHADEFQMHRAPTRF